jgi:hypothetical protein
VSQAARKRAEGLLQVQQTAAAADAEAATQAQRQLEGALMARAEVAALSEQSATESARQRQQRQQEMQSTIGGLQGELEAEQQRADEAEQRCAKLRRQLESSRASAVEEEEEELPPPPPAAKEAPARLERQRQRSAELEAENQRLVQVCLIHDRWLMADG